MASTDDQPRPVPALARASRLLDAVAADTEPRSVSQLARDLGLPRSTVHGLCRTLADLGVLSRAKGNTFEMGAQVLYWADAFKSQNTLTRAFATLTESLDPRLAVNLTLLTGRDVTYVSCRQSADPLGVRFQEGMIFPAAFVASGKAILSTYTDDEVVALMGDDWPEPLTSRGARSLAELLAELAQTRTRGYATDVGEVHEATISCGAPVFAAGSGDRAVAGVGIAMLSGRATEAALRTAGDVITPIRS